jgi:hypothetical protein
MNSHEERDFEAFILTKFVEHCSTCLHCTEATVGAMAILVAVGPGNTVENFLAREHVIAAVATIVGDAVADGKTSCEPGVK